MDQARIAAEAARILPLARGVLARYPYGVARVEHLATHSNILYRVVTGDGRQMVLRVGQPGSHSTHNVEYEVAWLIALRRDTDLDVVEPLPTVRGDLVVHVMDTELEVSRPCVLFSWVPGTPLTDGAGPYGYRQLGRASAALLAHGRAWRPDRLEGMRRWDRVFYYPNEPIVLEEHRYADLFPTDRLAVIRRAGLEAVKAIEGLWRSRPPQVVHGDLHEWNVHLTSGRLHVFDFEDVMLAHPAQDVSISLYSTRLSHSPEPARTAFRQGFEEIGSWPVEDDAQLDGLHAARQIMLMNYAAQVLPQSEAKDYVKRVFPWLEGYVRRYGLR